MKILNIDDKKVVLDDADYAMLKNEKWCINTYGYVCRWRKTNERGVSTLLYMSRILARPDGGAVVDHINGNKLDNRRSNLRVCTHQQNMMNQRPQKGRSSSYKGVSACKKSSKFRAYITINKKFKNLGFFDKEEDAAYAYNIAAENIFGEFAYLNDIPNSLLSGDF